MASCAEDAGARRQSRRRRTARIYGRGYRGPAPWIVGLIVLVLIVDRPLPGVHQEASRSPATASSSTPTFDNAADISADSPVRIAGVNVGKVTGSSATATPPTVTFTVDDAGPADPRRTPSVEIRPRLFLEGNFFLDLDPGSPSAPELADGGTIPITHTSTAVQLDEVLTALQPPERQSLQPLLEGFGTALTYQPTAADDVGQDPDGPGRDGGRGAEPGLRVRRPRRPRHRDRQRGAARHRAPRPLAADRGGAAHVFVTLAARETQLQDLIANFNTSAGALADESTNLSRHGARCWPRPCEQAQPVARRPQRRAAAAAGAGDRPQPGIAELPATIAAGHPWLDQARPLLSQAELGGIAQLLERSTPPSAHAIVETSPGCRAGGLQPLRHENLVPTGDIVVDYAGGTYPFGQGAPDASRAGHELPASSCRRPVTWRGRRGLRRQRDLPAGQHGRRGRPRQHPVSAGRLPQHHCVPATTRAITSARARRSRRPRRPTAPTWRARPTRCPTSTAPVAPASPATSARRNQRRWQP